MHEEEQESELSLSQSSEESGSLSLKYSRSSFEGNSSNSFVKEIAGDGVVELYTNSSR